MKSTNRMCCTMWCTDTWIEVDTV